MLVRWRESSSRGVWCWKKCHGDKYLGKFGSGKGIEILGIFIKWLIEEEIQWSRLKLMIGGTNKKNDQWFNKENC